MERMEYFDELYIKMSESSDIEDMELFGGVMREAMQYICKHSPEYADELMEKLCAICYKNYLTKKEADAIVSKMEPSAKWSMEHLERTLSAMGAPAEEEPCYNKYALLAAVSMVASDSADTIVKYAFDGQEDDAKLLEVCYHLALDKLKDKDRVFNIRKYFNV